MPAGDHRGSRSSGAPTRQRARRGSAVLTSVPFLLASLFLLTTAATAGTTLAKPPAGVLLLSSADPEEPDLAAMIEEIRSEIQEGSQEPVHFNLEYLGPSLITADPTYEKRIVPFLAEKYRGRTFRLVIAMGEELEEFADRFGEKLFPGAPRLFVLVTPPDRREWLAASPGRTGVIRRLNYLPTLEMALRQNPGTRQVLVVAGSSDFEKMELETASEQFRPYGSQLEFHYLTNMKLPEAVARVGEAGPRTIILLLNFLVDAAGEQLSPARVVPLLAKATNRPIYGTYASFVRSGAVGGSIADLTEVGRSVGQMGARILNGERPENIPVMTGEFQRPLFDWNQMQRWSLAATQLPAGSTVLNRPTSSSIWQRHKAAILGISAIFLGETLLVLLLLWMRIQRKRAEQELAVRLKWEKLTGSLAASLVGLPPQLFHAEAERAFELLMDSLELDRVSLFELSPGSTRLQLLYSRKSAETPPSPSQVQGEHFPWEMSRLLQGHSILVSNLEQLPAEAQALKGMLQQQGTRSFASLPLRADGAVFGALSFASLHAERAWSPDLVQYLQTVADIFGSALKRARVEQELSHVNAQEALILKSAGEGILGLDLEGKHTFVNQAAARMFGYAPEELIGRFSHALWHHTRRDGLPYPEDECPIYAALQDGEVHRGSEERFWRKDGSYFEAQFVSTPIRQQGRITGLVAVFQDISERRRAEETLRASEEKFHKAFRSSPVVVTMASIREDRFLDVNDTFLRLTGFRREDVIGRTSVELGLWENPRQLEVFTELLLGGHPLRNAECCFRMKNGEIRTALVSSELIETNGQLCTLSTLVDITDRKRAEEALRESEKRFRLMADSAPVLMWMTGPDKACTDVNRGWLEFTGRSLEQELGEGWTEGVHPEDRHHCVNNYRFAFEARQRFVMEYRLRRHDGQYRWVVDHGVPRYLGDGSFAGYIGCCTDISDQKEAEMARLELSGRLIHAQEEESARIARELHDDINQRLALLANGLQQMQARHGAGRGPHSESQLPSLLQLTNEISTDVQHLSHQLHPSKLQYLGLAAAVRDLCQEVSRQHTIQVECQVRDVPRELDENVSLSLFRTVQESLRNVVRHSRAKQAKVELAGESGLVRLRVSDDGIGFNPEDSRSRRGLGLVSMRERLRSVGGEFSIWSRPSLGTQVEGTAPAIPRRAWSAEILKPTA